MTAEVYVEANVYELDPGRAFHSQYFCYSQRLGDSVSWRLIAEIRLAVSLVLLYRDFEVERCADSVFNNCFFRSTPQR